MIDSVVILRCRIGLCLHFVHDRMCMVLNPRWMIGLRVLSQPMAGRKMEACLRMRLVVQERGNLERSVGRAAHFFQPEDPGLSRLARCGTNDKH
jgi:hypothetical protein